MCLLSRDGRSKLLPHTSQGSRVRSPRPTLVPRLRCMGRSVGELDGVDTGTRGGRAEAGSSSVAASVARLSGSSSRSSDEDAADEVDRHDDNDSPDTDLCSSEFSAELEGEPAGWTAARDSSDMDRSSGDSATRGPSQETSTRGRTRAP